MVEKAKLSAKDRKLLFALDFHARAPYTALAKKVGLSKQGTEYKLRSLQRRGVVKGFYPVVNVPKLGYIYCRTLITLQNITKEKRKEIFSYLQGHEKVFWLFQMQGPYDVLAVVWAKSIQEFKAFNEELRYKFWEHIKKTRETIMTDVIHYRYKHFVNTQSTDAIHIQETEERITIDDVDKRILTELCTDARASLVSIAQKVGESAKVISYRIKRLEQKKFIEGYRPLINHNTIGYTYYKVLMSLNNVSAPDVQRLKAYIEQHPLAIYIIEGVGLPGDLDIELMVPSNQDLFDFIEDIRFRFPALVGEYQTVTFMDTLKVKYVPF